MEENETITLMPFECLVSAHEEKIANKSVCYLGSQMGGAITYIHWQSLHLLAFQNSVWNQYASSLHIQDCL